MAANWQVDNASTGMVIIPDDPSYIYQRGTLTVDGHWVPLLSPKGYSLFNCQTRYILVHGPRKSGKSIAVANRLMRHAYEVNGAIVGIICKTLKNAKQGIWRDLISFVLPGWVDSGSVVVTQEPVMEPDTKMIKFRIRNAFGTESEFQLHSLPNESNTEAAFKGTRFSALWISEADQFKNRIVMDILGDQLRMTQVPYEQHLMILDCNPPEEGEDHWLYGAFFVDPQSNPALRESRIHIQITLDDNPFLPPKERAELEEKYKYDPVKYARFVEGKWVKDATAGHFDGFFMHNIHVVGTIDSRRDIEDVLVPDENCTMLLGGWDMGDVNHAFGLWYPRVNSNGEISYDGIDEVVEIENEISLYDFAQLALERIDFWRDWVKREYKRDVLIRHWGDSSMFNFRAGAATTDAATIASATGNRIIIRSVVKGAGSVRGRISLVKRLLSENRLFVSAKCQHTIDWLNFLKKGSTKGEVIKEGSEFKHKFDADSYVFMSEEPITAMERVRPITSTLKPVTLR